MSLAQDIARAAEVVCVRISGIQAQTLLGLESANPGRKVIALRELLGKTLFQRYQNCTEILHWQDEIQ